jgi:hypothetical protein
VEPEVIDSPLRRDFSRLTCIYSLRGVTRKSLRTPDRPEGFLEMGRFRGHYESVAEGMPGFTEAMHWDAPELKTSRGSFGRAREAEARIGHVPNSGTALVLRLDLDLNLVEAIVALQETCFRRAELRIGEDKPLEAMKSMSGIAAAAKEAGLDQEVHQVLAPSSSLLAELHGGGSQFDPDRLLRLVYREDEEFRPESSAMCYPKELNRPVGSICAHGRGVTVLGGAAEHVENGVVLTALELVTSTGRLRRARDRAVTALGAASSKPQAQKQGLEDQRQEMAGFAGQLRQLELELSFGVDTYLDSLRLPEIVLGAYRQSLAGVLELEAGARATALMVERLQRAIGARHLELETQQATEDEARRKSAGAALAYFTVIALPVGAILAFLGANITQVSSTRSMWSLDYVGYYLMFAAIAFVGFLVYFGARVWWKPPPERHSR